MIYWTNGLMCGFEKKSKFQQSVNRKEKSGHFAEMRFRTGKTEQGKGFQAKRAKEMLF